MEDYLYQFQLKAQGISNKVLGISQPLIHQRHLTHTEWNILAPILLKK